VTAPLGNGDGAYLTAWRTLPRSPLIVSVSISKQQALSGWWTYVYVIGGARASWASFSPWPARGSTHRGRIHARTVAERDRPTTHCAQSGRKFPGVHGSHAVLVS